MESTYCMQIKLGKRIPFYSIGVLLMPNSFFLPIFFSVTFTSLVFTRKTFCMYLRICVYIFYLLTSVYFHLKLQQQIKKRPLTNEDFLCTTLRLLRMINKTKELRNKKQKSKLYFPT